MLDSTVLLPQRSITIDGASSLDFAIRLVDVRAGAASAAVDGPLGVPIASGRAALPIDGWVRISGDGNYRGALRVRAAYTFDVAAPLSPVALSPVAAPPAPSRRRLNRPWPTPRRVARCRPPDGHHAPSFTTSYIAVDGTFDLH